MPGPADTSDPALREAVSDVVARLYLDKFGKGPLHAETFVNGDIITTVMHDVFTAAEQALIDAGHSDNVLATRMLWQQATDAAFKAGVGDVVGRPVQTVISGYELTDGVATEVFVLAPRA